MPQSEAKFQINQFTGGLVTDANPLGDTGTISIDEDNLEIRAHGGRRRRRGARVEAGFTEHPVNLTSDLKRDSAFETFTWEAVGNVPGLEFAVYQQGGVLYFYDKAVVPLSAGRKSFTVALGSFKLSTSTTDEVIQTRVSGTSGKGAFFVAGKHVEPFYIEYDEATDSVTATQINIKIRDFEEQTPGVAGSKEILLANSSPTLLYDLMNQGWYHTGPYMRDNGSTNRARTPVLTLYIGHSDIATYLPRKSTQWHLGKYLVPSDTAQVSDTFISPQQVRAAPTGNTLAPFGHYILDAFNKDRNQAVLDEEDWTGTFSYLDFSSLPVETETERPNFITFYAGRAWYLLRNKLYYSQLLDEDSFNKAGRCYQEGDPTSEGESDVVATDGGVITIADMSVGVAMAALDNVLLIFAENGVWSVSGTGGASFSAVDFTVSKLGNIRCESPSSVTASEGIVFFWAETGIYAIRPGDIRDVPDIQDLTDQRINNFYNSIPQNSKRNAKGVYDPVEKIVHWFYKASNDSSDIDYNRYAYDRALNFSLKFSAFFPWSIEANDSYQISGAVISSGLSANVVTEAVVDSGGTDVTDSGGTTVTVNVTEMVESSQELKLLVIKDDNATWGEFGDTSFLDWNDESEGVSYTSYLETFYHLTGDDAMAMMQAPYVYTYFKRTEEEDVVLDPVVLSLSDFTAGEGITFNETGFISARTATSPNPENPDLSAQGGLILGEDGKRYQFFQGGGGAGSGVDDLVLYDVDVDPGAATISTDYTTVHAAVVAAGLEPPGGGFVSSSGDMSFFAVAGTPYIVGIGTQAAGTDTSKWVAYYRINSASALELVGGYGGREGALDVQFSPPAESTSGFSAIGLVYDETNAGDEIASTDTRATVQNNDIRYKYPLAVTWRGEGRSTVMVLPSINGIINDDTRTEDSVDHWLNREDSLGTPFDANILILEDNPSGSDHRNRGWFLPRDGKTNYYHKFYQADIDEHNAGTETTTSTYLQGIDATYPSGAISSVPINYTSSGSDEFGFTTGLGTAVVRNTEFTGFPFTDETDNYDGTAGLATENFYLNPAAYPLYKNNPTAPWILFFPKLFTTNGDQDKILIRIFGYDPVTGLAQEIDNAKGQVVDFSADMGLGTTPTPQWATVDWVNDAGDNKGKMTLIVKYAFGSNTYLVTTDIGTFNPVANGITDVLNYVSGNLGFLESSCLMSTRWDWADNAASGKVSTAVQVYRDGRTGFATDPSNPETTGLPLVISKNKTRGRGRTLQLRFSSEEGKEYELYGWGVWAQKNMRF